MARSVIQIRDNLVRFLKPIFRNALIAKIVGEHLNDVLGGAASVSFSVGAEAGDAIVVSCQAKDVLGNDVAEVVHLKILICANAAGTALNTNNYTIAAGTDGAVGEVLADKILECTTESDGDLDISLTLSGGGSCYLLAIGPNGRIIGTSAVVTHAA